MSSSNVKKQQTELMFPAHLVAETLRSGSYGNSANAIAEIVDNSYDAEATEIHIALILKSKKLDTIAVLDNGKGMDEITLCRSIQYGRHQGKKDGKRFGKFGVGLLSASFNQCKELEVYSWNEGLRDVVDSTSIHVEDCPEELPPVQAKPLPDFFEKAFETFDRDTTNIKTHGTLVIWRDFDRLTWKRAETFSRKIQIEIGRIYRNFIKNRKLKVVITVVEQSGTKFNVEKIILVPPVDPLFISYWDCKELKQYLNDLEKIKDDFLNYEAYGITAEEVDLALSRKTLFKPFDFENENDNAYDEEGNITPSTYTVKDDNGMVIGKYQIIASYRWPKIVRVAAEAGNMALRNPGKTSYGKLAEDLRGVSIMRNGRELKLDTNWLRADETVDRWIALSIDFEPSLDAIFGLSNDKQNVVYLSDLASAKTKDMSTLSSDYNDHNKHVLVAAKRIHKTLRTMSAFLKKKDAPPKDPKIKNISDLAEESIKVKRIISEKISKRSENESTFVSGIDDKEPIPDKLKESYIGATIDHYKLEGKKAAERIDILINNHLKVDVVSDPVASSSDMFSAINNASGAMVVRLNTKHPLYESLQHILMPDEESNLKEGIDECQRKLDKAFSAVRKIIIGFARAELEATSNQVEQYERVRREWSYVVRDLFKEDE